MRLIRRRDRIPSTISIGLAERRRIGCALQIDAFPNRYNYNRPGFPSLLGMENTRFPSPGYPGYPTPDALHVQFVASHGIATEGIRLVRTFNKYPSLLHLRQFYFLLPPSSCLLFRWQNLAPISLLIFRLPREDRGKEEGGKKRFLSVAGAPYVCNALFPHPLLRHVIRD